MRLCKTLGVLCVREHKILGLLEGTDDVESIERITFFFFNRGVENPGR